MILTATGTAGRAGIINPILKIQEIQREWLAKVTQNDYGQICN